jgi:hypothetical protein
MVKELDLDIDQKEPIACRYEDLFLQAQRVERFFRAYPSVLRCLTRLHLHDVCFAEWDIHHFLFDCCGQLQHLSMHECDAGERSVWQINAPNSDLRSLEIYGSGLESVEVLCLPKLERLHWEIWFYLNPPLRFGSVPALKELLLLNDATLDQVAFSLSEVLHGANIHTLNNYCGKFRIETSMNFLVALVES